MWTSAAKNFLNNFAMIAVSTLETIGRKGEGEGSDDWGAAAPPHHNDAYVSK